MRQEFLGQREFIAPQFREVDRRFEEVEKKICFRAKMPVALYTGLLMRKLSEKSTWDTIQYERSI